LLIPLPIYFGSSFVDAVMRTQEIGLSAARAPFRSTVVTGPFYDELNAGLRSGHYCRLEIALSEGRVVSDVICALRTNLVDCVNEKLRQRNIWFRIFEELYEAQEVPRSPVGWR
jgi:hypothetical protein